MPTFPQAPVIGLIPAGELADLQAAWDAALDQTCIISRVARSHDGYGGTTDGYTPDATISKVLIEPVNTHEDQIIGTRVGTGQIEFLARFSGFDNPMPNENDRLIACSDGHSYEVITLVDMAPSYSVNNTYGVRRLT